jgi:hypothetical protein
VQWALHQQDYSCGVSRDRGVVLLIIDTAGMTD